MHKPAKHARSIYGLSSLAALVWATMVVGSPSPQPLNAASMTASAATACAVWMEETIPIHNDRVEVIAKYSQPIGGGMTVSFPEDAGVDVIQVSRAPSGEPLAVLLVLNTARAMEGKWWMTLQGDAGECIGDVYVGVPK